MHMTTRRSYRATGADLTIHAWRLWISQHTPKPRLIDRLRFLILGVIG